VFGDVSTTSSNTAEFTSTPAANSACKIQCPNTTRRIEDRVSTNPNHFSANAVMAITAFAEPISPLHLPQRVRWIFIFPNNNSHHKNTQNLILSTVYSKLSQKWQGMFIFAR
jgi:hypothetical protein